LTSSATNSFSSRAVLHEVSFRFYLTDMVEGVIDPIASTVILQYEISSKSFIFMETEPADGQI